jgi:hypothetical protein
MRKNNFWGILLILLGITFIGRRVFQLNLPTLTVIFSFVFIYWGISMIVAKPEEPRDGRGSEERIFTDSEIKANINQDKYDILFSSSTVDLTTLPVPLEKRKIKIDTIFSRSIIRINPEVPALIKVDAVFASAHLPNNTHISFGDYTYATRSYREGLPHLYIKADVVFGQMDIIE